MKDKVISSLFQQVDKEGYARKMGLRLIEAEKGRAVVEMALQGDTENIFGTTHGGAIFSVIDEAFQVSCNSHGTMALALNMSITYHNPPEKGTTLRAESREIHRSQKTGTYDIKVWDNRQNLIASCMALAYRKKERLPFLEE